MSQRLLGQRALITGGSSGIGLAIAQAFHREGAHVIVADQAPPPGDLPFAPLDVSDWTSVQKTVHACGSHSVGVMIARGDLAVECGYERLAEAQEEILWISEAAHVPVVWATQVLETLTKTGRPTRAEITDAAMGERAECVMLNKGPYVVEAVRTLDDILRRMEAHQDKKRSMLRKLGVAAGYTGAAGQSG